MRAAWQTVRTLLAQGVIGIVLVILALALRSYQYDQVPSRGWTYDEYAFTWAGMSLWQHGVPEAWSWIPAYGNVPVLQNADGPVRLVRPWFDHPPGLPLLVGGLATLQGQREFFQTNLSLVRPLMVLIGALNVGLLYLLARRLASPQVAAMATFLYAINPVAVMLSRLVLAENLLTTCLLAVLLCVSAAEDDLPRYRSWLSAALALAALALWFKLTGIAIVLVLAILCLLQQKPRWYASVLAVAFLSLMGILLYAAQYDLGLFLSVQRGQADRLASFSLLPHLTLMGFPVLDPVSIGGFAALPLLGWIPSRMARILGVSMVTYLCTLLAMGAHSHWYVWYAIPLFPLFALFVTQCAARAYTQGQWWMLGAAAALAWHWSIDALLTVARWRAWLSPVSARWCFVASVIAVGVVALYAYAKPERRRALVTTVWYPAVGVAFVAAALGTLTTIRF